MSERSKQDVGIEFDESGKPMETVAYRQYRQYYDNFLTPSGILDALNERRRFFRGDQYSDSYSKNAPKPTLNLVQEGVTKIAAKITGTKRHISVIADKDDEDLSLIDSFIEHQNLKMNRDLTIAETTMVALIDGTSVVFTAFDSDTIGTEGLYKGFLKDYRAPFEETFWSNPWTDDPQEMRYCGYYLDMEVGAAKKLIEGDKSLKEKKEKYIAKENFFVGPPPYSLDKIIDSDLTRVYVRFFRKDEEVYFELSTEYVTLTEHPHALNPKITEERLSKILKEAADVREKARGFTEIPDYPTDEAKYTLYTDAVRESHDSHVKAKHKFSRYPVALCIPYPEMPYKCVLGRSLSAAIIPNQKLYNYCYLLVTLIMQYHAMPKWVAKPNALQNQQIDTTPNQVIIDYSRITDVGGNGFGITRMSSGEAINSNLIQIGDTIASNTRFILGFANLEASGTNIDSGYEYAQRMKQINLPLEIPQQRVWNFCKEMSKTDMMYYTHYIDNAKFYVVRSDAEHALNENYRVMAQNLIDNGKSPLPRGTILPKTRKYEIRNIDNTFFDDEFDVTIEVEQGIAGSELTESQHYNQIWQYVAQGNFTADKIRMLVNGDPAISRKTRARVGAALEELETSQLAEKDQQIEALKQAVVELQGFMKFSQQTIASLQAKQKATEAAAAEQAKVAAALLKGRQQAVNEQGQPMSEGEAKSRNAKGEKGAAFSNDSIYNTGA